jgi:hypothetical protein
MREIIIYNASLINETSAVANITEIGIDINGALYPIDRVVGNLPALTPFHLVAFFPLTYNMKVYGRMVNATAGDIVSLTLIGKYLDGDDGV